MGERRGSVMGRIPRRIEDRVKEHRERDTGHARRTSRPTGSMASCGPRPPSARGERQRLLAEAVADGEADRTRWRR